MDTRHPEYQYLDLMQEILDKGEKQEDSIGVNTYSLFGRQIRFDLSEGLPLLTTKKVYWKGVLHELYWFISGDTNIKYLVDNNVHIWDDYPYKIYSEKVAKGLLPAMEKDDFIAKIASDDEFAKQHGDLTHCYGEAWRRWPAHDGRTVDQLGWAIQQLRDDPDAHNTVVTAWNPEYMYKMAKPEEALRFPICHNMYQLNIKNGKVCLHLYQRSADIFLGVPFNIASYALLTAVIAKVLGREPGEFVHTFGDVHIYENHRDAAKEQLTREPKPFPTIKLGDFKTIDDFRPEHVELIDYDAHPAIKAELSVTGGVNVEGYDALAKKAV